MASEEDILRTAMENQSHILVVDDDTRTRDLIRRNLERNGFRVTTAASAEEARGRMRGLLFDLAVVDIMMEGEDGLSLLQWVRGNSGMPVLLLTAMGEPEDRVRGLELGADDYLAKPFEPMELVLRIRSILRRAVAQEPPAAIGLGSCAYDLARQELTSGGAVIDLTAIEQTLLSVLARRAGDTVSREELLRECNIRGSERNVDVQVTRLRRKIEPVPRRPKYLHTVRGRGYVLRPDRMAGER